MIRPLAMMAVFALTGCGAGDPGAPALVADGESFGKVPLFWTHPSGEAAGGYAIEVSTAAGPFQVAASLGPAALFTTWIIGPDVPERSDILFRVRALPDPAGTRASNVVVHHHGVLPPTLVCDVNGNTNGCLPASDGFHLQWAIRSRVADGILLQRRTATLSGPAPDWKTMPTSFPATSFTDTDMAGWVAPFGFEYQLMAISGGERSDAARATTAFAR